MRIKKVKSLNDKITIDFEKESKAGGMTQQSISCPEPPAPEFDKALKALKPHLIQLCELESIDETLVTVTGASFGCEGEDDVMSAVITGTKSHKYSNGSLALNSPKKTFEPIKGDIVNSKLVHSEGCVEALEALISAAEGYAGGKRGQADLFDNEEKTNK